MTVTRATTPRPLVSHLRSARVSGRVSAAACHTASKGIAASMIIANPAYRRGRVAPRHSAVVPSAR